MKAISKTHVPALDGVRGIAILVVLVHNLSIFVGKGSIADRLWTVVTEAGWIGVELFFVLSGFLITGILLDEPARSSSEEGSSPNWTASLKGFYIRRSLRIFPLYYAFLVLYFLVAPLFAPSLARPFAEVKWYWVYLSNWSCLWWGVLPGLGHVWSLAVEEQFYLVWPWLVGGLSRRFFLSICLSIVIVAFGARLGFWAIKIDDAWIYCSTVTRMDALAIGALLALGLRSEVWRARIASKRGRVSIAVVGALLLLMVKTHGMNRHNPLVQIVGYLLIAVASAALVAYAAWPSPPRLLAHPVLRFFGRYSYGIYIIHAPLKHLAFDTWKPTIEAHLESHPVATDVAFILVLTAVTIGVALVSWTVLEKPCLRLKERWAAR